MGIPPMQARLTAVLIFAAVAARSQAPSPANQPEVSSPANQPEVSSKDTPVTFSSRVNLVSVPVVVRGRDGHAVGNLKKEDFQLYDKGKLQVITKFSVETSPTAVDPPASALKESSSPGVPSGPVPPTLPDRYVAYLVDDIHLTRGDLLNTRQALNRHLDGSLDRSSRAAIFTTSGLMLADFTGDRAKLHAAVNRIQPWTSGPDPNQDCPPVTYYVADVLTNQRLYFSGTLFSDSQIIAMARSDQMLEAVLEEAEQCSALPTEPLMIQVRTTIRQVLSYGDRETTLSLGALSDVVRRIIAMPGSRSLVLLSPGFHVNSDHRLAEADVLERAIRARVAVDTIDMRGLYTDDPGDADAPRYGGPMSAILRDADSEAATDAGGVLEELADGTGGKYFHNDNDLKGGLDELAARPEFLYVLGFSPVDLKTDGSYHGLKVAVRGVPGASLQMRRGYWAPKHAIDSDEAAKEAISDAVFSRDEMAGIPIDLQTEFFKLTDETAELTVVTHIKADGLRFRKADERNNGELTVVSGLFDANGNFIKGMQRVVTFHLRDQSLVSLRNAGIAVKETFNVPPGRYVVRLVVRDAEGDTMAARNGGVEIP